MKSSACRWWPKSLVEARGQSHERDACLSGSANSGCVLTPATAANATRGLCIPGLAGGRRRTGWVGTAPGTQQQTPRPDEAVTHSKHPRILCSPLSVTTLPLQPDTANPARPTLRLSTPTDASRLALFDYRCLTRLTAQFGTAAAAAGQLDQSACFRDEAPSPALTHTTLDKHTHTHAPIPRPRHGVRLQICRSRTTPSSRRSERVSSTLKILQLTSRNLRRRLQGPECARRLNRRAQEDPSRG